MFPSHDRDNYHLFSLSGSSTNSADQSQYNQHLILEPYTGNDISSSGDASQYGRLKFIKHSDFSEFNEVTTEYFPVYNGNFWNIFIGVEVTSDFTSIEGLSTDDIFAPVTFGAYQANHLKSIYNATASMPNDLGQINQGFGRLNQTAVAWGLQYTSSNLDGEIFHPPGS